MSVKYMVPVVLECDTTRCLQKVNCTAVCVEDANSCALKLPLFEPKLPPGWGWYNGKLYCPLCLVGQ